MPWLFLIYASVRSLRCWRFLRQGRGCICPDDAWLPPVPASFCDGGPCAVVLERMAPHANKEGEARLFPNFAHAASPVCEDGRWRRRCRTKPECGCHSEPPVDGRGMGGEIIGLVCVVMANGALLRAGILLNQAAVVAVDEWAAGGHGQQIVAHRRVARRQRSASFVGRPGFVRSGMGRHAPAQPTRLGKQPNFMNFGLRKAGILRDESLCWTRPHDLGDLRTQGSTTRRFMARRDGEGRRTSCFQACSCPLLCPSVSCDVFSR